jgi:lysophospholipase L1-like esterase
MGRVSRARRIALAAAYGGGGLGLLGAATTALLFAEVKLAHWAIQLPEAPPPGSSGDYGDGYSGEPLRMVLIGDSTAAGLGADLPAQTPGALLAGGLADILRRPVRLHNFAVVGALSCDLYPQLDWAVDTRPDVAVVLVGGNDVTHAVRPPVAAEHLTAVVRRLRAAGAEVVVGTCPDLGTIRPFRQPLRWMCRRWSREIAAAQTVAAVQAGARTVSLADLLGPEFLAAPDEMFSSDHFHPSPAGYAKASAAILPTVAAAVGADVAPATGPVASLPEAAVAAADRGGTEVSAATTTGARPGRLAQLRRRVRLVTTLRGADPRGTGPRRVEPEPATEA